MIFSRKPPYSTEELQMQVSTIERLHKLRDMCGQKSIITKDPKWDGEIERYARNIESAQRVLQHMMERIAGKKA